ncbi:hypothetical protein CONLIGDRAFT_377875 [Coniochaeta ligniaria NRRL 30616]|uniref:Uncharacterized protein n=1 Tax=Coniochaeta ligniaria NRRL 30616 TaxID=1408157 RepID=A0A1J7JGR4_9PEZI|nr:hypothetical protein CONLIGDRAFT_377875 [Coniochaeta ligniaria NRRL 30616]
MPAELPLLLEKFGPAASSRRARLRLIKSQPPTPATARKATTTAIAMPAAAPALSPWLVDWGVALITPAAGVLATGVVTGVTVTVLVTPPVVKVETVGVSVVEVASSVVFLVDCDQSVSLPFFQFSRHIGIVILRMQPKGGRTILKM